MGLLLKLAIAAFVAIALYGWVKRQLGGRKMMPPGEARALLGVQQDAGLAEIRDAHRRLIAKVHPDAGGSTELATRVNEARDALVSQLNRKPPRAS